MKKSLSFCLLLTLVLSCAAQSSYSDCWFYVSRSLSTEQDVKDITELVAVAEKAQYNGMLLACGVESYALWGDARKKNLAKVRAVCEQTGIEIIPILWSVGYGTMLSRNRNIVEGLLCKDVPYESLGEVAVYKPMAPVEINNGDFEQDLAGKNKIPGWDWTDKFGSISFLDTEVKKSGAASLRLEPSAQDKHGHARASQQIPFKPYRQYRLSCWVKTEDLDPVGAFKVQMYRKEGGALSAISPRLQATQDWQYVSLLFNCSADNGGVLYLGLWGGKSGKIWLDDVKVEELGVLSVLRRPGTPFTVRNAETGVAYVEGKDYQAVPGISTFALKPTEISMDLKLATGSSIKKGDKLLIDYYNPCRAGNSQFTVCMSEPELYEFFKQSAPGVMQALQPKKWFLSMDEIRAGGTCAACMARNTDMAHILADCIQQQRAIIKDVCPEADIYIWSDMLDPAHNAHDNYYACKGTYAGVWELIPKDLIISCWYGSKRNESMSFFSSRGFRTQAAAYYDADTLDSSRDWLVTCNQTENCTGIIYTSWRNKYALLAAFGELVKKEGKPLTGK